MTTFGKVVDFLVDFLVKKNHHLLGRELTLFTKNPFY